jgi:hypothetical protein
MFRRSSPSFLLHTLLSILLNVVLPCSYTHPHPLILVYFILFSNPLSSHTLRLTPSQIGRFVAGLVLDLVLATAVSRCFSHFELVSFDPSDSAKSSHHPTHPNTHTTGPLYHPASHTSFPRNLSSRSLPQALLLHHPSLCLSLYHSLQETDFTPHS